MSYDSKERLRLFASMSDAGGRLRVRNALNPVLWLCGIVVMPCLGVVVIKDDPPVIVSVILGAVVGTALVGFLYLLFADRDRLQSEEFLIRTRTLQLMEQKGTRKAVDLSLGEALKRGDFYHLPDLPEGPPHG